MISAQFTKPKLLFAFLFGFVFCAVFCFHPFAYTLDHSSDTISPDGNAANIYLALDSSTPNIFDSGGGAPDTNAPFLYAKNTTGGYDRFVTDKYLSTFLPVGYYYIFSYCTSPSTSAVLTLSNGTSFTPVLNNSSPVSGYKFYEGSAAKQASVYSACSDIFYISSSSLVTEFGFIFDRENSSINHNTNWGRVYLMRVPDSIATDEVHKEISNQFGDSMDSASSSIDSSVGTINGHEQDIMNDVNGVTDGLDFSDPVSVFDGLPAAFTLVGSLFTIFWDVPAVRTLCVVGLMFGAIRFILRSDATIQRETRDYNLRHRGGRDA